MVKTVKVPEPFIPLFEVAEKYVSSLFAEFKQDPTQGTIHVGPDRYILIRGESLFATLFDQLEGTFGTDQAREFIYNIARIIGKSDSQSFTKNRKITDPNEKLSTGPVHFAYSGWAFVDILPTSKPSPDANYFLHYRHPNTFESEIYKRKKIIATSPICFFSAGYSAGWCSEAYGIEVHAREIHCTAHGDEHCEFIMAPFEKLDEYARQFGG
jgi:hypothetical protein